MTPHNSWHPISVPYLPTNPDLFDLIFSVAKLSEKDVFYDLGCGDGRIVIEAAKRANVKKAVGIEIDENLVKVAREYARKAGVEDRVEIIHGDFFTVPIRDATVVYMYLTKRANELLKPKLIRELKIGTRIVTLDFEIPGWKPVSIINKNRLIQGTIYLYVRGVSDIYDIMGYSPVRKVIGTVYRSLIL
ncbi:class I SAM-dependent methyltransferase [Desulfurococcaceae archaeon MEX13E-LK6-19]|nr:class I SAM-dependent methyltransferase [Desulfurococcaceae archaeon MEX13E-LK6-19]